MITINLTLLIEFGLFILFLWVANKMMFRPILRVMDEREEKITGDTTNAERDSAEAQMAEERFIAQITDAHQEAARRLRHARQEAYAHNRVQLEQHRIQAERELLVHHDEVQRALEAQRQQYGEQLPVLVDAIDRQLRMKGRLL